MKRRMNIGEQLCSGWNGNVLEQHDGFTVTYRLDEKGQRRDEETFPGWHHVEVAAPDDRPTLPHPEIPVYVEGRGYVEPRQVWADQQQRFEDDRLDDDRRKFVEPERRAPIHG